MLGRQVRILLARFALDGHDRGIITIINECKNKGMEVIYIHFTDAEQVVKSAIAEDVDVIGVTSSMGEHAYVAVRIIEALKKNQADIPLIMGGVIPTVDITRLMDIGVKAVFGPGSSPRESVSFISKVVARA